MNQYQRLSSNILYNHFQLRSYCQKCKGPVQQFLQELLSINGLRNFALINIWLFLDEAKQPLFVQDAHLLHSIR